MQNFMISVNAVMPFAVYLAIGCLIRVRRIADEAFMSKLNQFVFKVFFPFIMFRCVYTLDFDTGVSAFFVVFSVIELLTVIGLLVLIVPRIVRRNDRRGVVIQALYRSNTVLFAIPLAQSVFGEEAASAAGLLVAVLVPIYNITAILILETFSSGGRHSVRELAMKLLNNPLIRGAIVGAVFLLLRVPLPQCVMKPVNAIADMATPLAVIVLGSTLRFDALANNRGILTRIMLVRLIGLPCLALLVSFFVEMSEFERFMQVILYATPIAASSYPMAVNIGGDGELAGQCVVVSTVCSVITIFLWILLLNSFGLI